LSLNATGKLKNSSPVEIFKLRCTNLNFINLKFITLSQDVYQVLFLDHFSKLLYLTFSYCGYMLLIETPITKIIKRYITM